MRLAMPMGEMFGPGVVHVNFPERAGVEPLRFDFALEGVLAAADVEILLRKREATMKRIHRTSLRIARAYGGRYPPWMAPTVEVR